ncbi:MAG: STAS domain-containing protein [Terriglobia bacterium]|jgi:anti-sigma B factor antagonist
MEFTKRQIRPGVVVLEMTGSIRIGPNCQQIEHVVDDLIRQHETRVIFDLSGVSFIDSSGIGTIVRSLTRLKKLGGTLRLTGVKGMVEGVFKLTQIDRIIEIYLTASEASQDLPPVSNP